MTDRAGNTITRDLGILDMDLCEHLVTSAHDAAGDPVSLAWDQWSGRPGEAVNGTTWIKAQNTMSATGSFTLDLPSSLTGQAPGSSMTASPSTPAPVHPPPPWPRGTRPHPRAPA